MMKILTSMIIPKLEFAEVVWSAYRSKNFKKLDRIITKMGLELKGQSYKGRLKEMQLQIIREERERRLSYFI